jgi:hypothetical protein
MPSNFGSNVQPGPCGTSSPTLAYIGSVRAGESPTLTAVPFASIASRCASA